MRELTLLKIALIVSLSGLILLYFMSENIEIDESSIEKINKGEIGEVVKVKGVIKSISNAKGVTFLTIAKPEEVKVILFDEIDFDKGQYVEIVGEIGEYNGEREIIGNAVRIIWMLFWHNNWPYTRNTCQLDFCFVS